jgi:hypothetical protein
MRSGWADIEEHGRATRRPVDHVHAWSDRYGRRLQRSETHPPNEARLRECLPTKGIGVATQAESRAMDVTLRTGGRPKKASNFSAVSTARTTLLMNASV